MTPDFELFWDTFPRQRRVNRPGAFKAFQKALKEATFEQIMFGLEGYRSCDDVIGGFACMPTTWLNQCRWEADYTPKPKKLDKSVYLSLLKQKRDGQFISDKEREYIRMFEAAQVG